MTDEFARILALVDAYLGNGEFEPLWRPIAGSGADSLQANTLSAGEERLWEELYEIVYMGQERAADVSESRHGLLGGPELQARLREWRTSAVATLSA